MKTKLAVKQEEGKEISKEVLAKSIIDIGAAFAKLKTSGLNERAIVTLVSASCGLGHGTVKAVLGALGDLRKNFTTL